MIKLITQRDRIRDVDNRWYQQYRRSINNPSYDPQDKYGDQHRVTVYVKLRALDKETASEKDVDDIIGNKSWTMLYCNECNDVRVETVVEVGEVIDGNTQSLCVACVRKAYDLVKDL